ncbi:MAG TPA: SCO family protein [Usitatibacter sp.]|nr:SCO family protein [Usitatibacter sp.]
MRRRNAEEQWKQTLLFFVFWITMVALGAASAYAAPKGSPWNEAYFPDVTLVNQDGERLRFYDDMLRDKVVMINFIFATCEDSCPLETAKLRQVQEQLGERVGREVFMYSISITPEQDTPAVLKEYMRKFKVGLGWQFFTGRAQDILLIRKKLGLVDAAGERPDEHTMSMIVGNDRTGVWMKRSSFDNPKVLARVVLSRLMGVQVAGPGYAQATHQVAIDPGEDLFRRRCQDCHTVGAGEAIGPDLRGVTELRERAWLVRYLQAPNEVLAAQDPIAMSLNAKYKGVPMPNLRLGEGDVQALIGYLERESRRLGEEKRADASDGESPAHSHAHGHAHSHSH